MLKTPCEGIVPDIDYEIGPMKEIEIIQLFCQHLHAIFQTVLEKEQMYTWPRQNYLQSLQYMERFKP